MRNLSSSIALTITISALGIGLTGCSATSEPSSPQSSAVNDAQSSVPPVAETVSLVGEWEQSNKNSPTNFQRAVITDDTIEIYWIADDEDVKSLYWAGSIDPTIEHTKHFTWDSKNDLTKTESALLASTSESKTFTFDNDEISYDVTALGTTTTVRLARK